MDEVEDLIRVEVDTFIEVSIPVAVAIVEEVDEEEAVTIVVVAGAAIVAGADQGQTMGDHGSMTANIDHILNQVRKRIRDRNLLNRVIGHTRNPTIGRLPTKRHPRHPMRLPFKRKVPTSEFEIVLIGALRTQDKPVRNE